MIELETLKQTVASCTKCNELCSSRKQTVFGTGPVPTRLMFIGEAPGAEENEQGEPFVGAAGKLLTNIIKACGWSREDIFIANILKCQPPKNRKPTKEEAANCREYLDKQIDLVNPQWIVCWGSTAGCNLLSQNGNMSSLRGRIFTYKNSKVICTYHPAYLLPHRNPSKKNDVWEDLQVVMAGLKNENS